MPHEVTQILFSQMGQEIDDPVIVDLMNQALKNPDLLSLAAGFTDNAVMPKEIVGQLVAELTEESADSATLQYGTNQGRPRLRDLCCDVLGEHPSEERAKFEPSKVVVTNGSQQALYLAVQVLCDPGDIILVEEPSYFVCLEMLKGLGVRAVGIPCSSEGAIDSDGFAKLLADLEASGEKDRVKGIYLVSYFSNPSGRSMTLEEKEAVAETLKVADYMIPVLEDGAYRELYFDEPHPVPSVLSLSVFDPFPLVYLGTYTKPFATGLKVGFGYCTHAGLLGKMLCIKGHQDFGSSNFSQSLIERAVENGHFHDHLKVVRPHYQRKAALVHRALEESGLRDAGWDWLEPKGGLLFWLRGPEKVDTRMGSDFCNGCIEQGVLYVPGDLCLPEGGAVNCLRLSFGAIEESRLEEAVSRFVKEALRWSE